MNIGVDIRVLIDKEYSGVSWYTLDLLTAILTADRENQYFLYYNSFKDLSERLPKFSQPKIKIFSTKFPNKIFNYFLQKIFSWPKLDKIFPSWEGFGEGFANKIDVFWSPHINFSSFSKDCKKILTVHDISFLLYPEFFSWRKNLWHRLIGLEKMMENSDIIIAISKNTKSDIIKKFNISPEKIKVVYPGVGAQFKKILPNDLQKMREKYDLPEKFIFNIGSFEPRKNIAGLIRAFDAAAKEIKDYYLVLAGGKGWKNKEIFSAVEKARNKNRIRILGYIDNADKSALYNLATIFAYPSFYEGFGLPILEAMACGCPVITGDSSSLPEAAGSAAVLVDVNNERAMEKAIIVLANDEKIRQELSRQGLEQAKKFSWEKSADEYIKIFSSCHSRESGNPELVA